MYFRLKMPGPAKSLVIPYLLLIALLGRSLDTYGQEIVWGSEVVDISSEYSNTEYSAEKALGPPDAMALGTKRSNAWLASKISKDEFIMVAFDQPIKANQLVIAEAENPGAIKSVYLYDSGFYEYTNLVIEPRWISDEVRFFHRKFDQTPFEVHAVKVIMDVTAIPGRNTIDAIGISNSEESIIEHLDKHKLLDLRNFRAEKMDDNVNSRYEENNPILSPDGNTLYFSRQFDPGNVGGARDPEDIWYSEREGDGWSEAKNLGPPWNTSGPNFICSIREIDGEEHFILGNVYLDGNRMLEGVSRARRLNDSTFTRPEEMIIDQAYNYSNRADYYLVNDTTMLLSVHRDDGLGKRDIYVTRFREYQWSKPMNLGPVINTYSEDVSPQMDDLGKILYYSSEGFNGHGGLDVYMSERLDDTWENWSTPVNLGIGVNGGGDESYFSLSRDDRERFYSRGDTLKPADIYYIKLRPTMIVASGQVLDESDGSPVPGAFVYFRNRDGDEFFGLSDDHGQYKVIIHGGDTWTASAEAVGYELVSTLEVETTFDDAEVPAIYLRKVKQSDHPTWPSSVRTLIDPMTQKPFRGTVLFFDLDKAHVRAEYYSELQSIARFLVQHKGLIVEIHGHADSRSSDKYNLDLSIRRAERISEYLRNYGVHASRVSIYAHGESRLSNDCEDGVDCSQAQHEKNRRIELKIKN